MLLRRAAGSHDVPVSQQTSGHRKETRLIQIAESFKTFRVIKYRVCVSVCVLSVHRDVGPGKAEVY